MFSALERAGPWRQAIAGTAVLTLLVLFLTMSVGAYDALRERTFDLMLARLARPVGADRVMVVDIDRRSLERIGAWPWSREQLATLVTDILAAKPAAVGLDILIEGADERSPAAVARRLADLTNSSAARQLATGLPDSDERLASAIRKAPVVLGLALDPEPRSEQPPMAPILVQGRSDLYNIWQATSVAGPPQPIAEAAAGFGVLALAGDVDGRVRRVPLLAAASERLRPGLALETGRIAQPASAYVLAGGNVIRTGSLAVPFNNDAALRLVPLRQQDVAARTISAADVDAPDARGLLQGRIVLIGSSAPELGGLRLASGGDLLPSVQLQASAVSQLLSGLHPRRPVSAEIYEAIAIVLAALAGLGIALRWPPARAGLVALGLAAVWILATSIAMRGWQALVDPIAVPVAVLACFGLSALAVSAHARRQEAALRRRFEQHLAPELVSRIVQHPELLKLAGETREVTILFTDVEGFTPMTERSDPATLIRVLDRYLDEMSAIIVAHGGMVEKIVGDGFHGLFNAPLDLERHADKAVACALEIRAYSERFAAEPEPRSLGFGRTRIGIETGPVIVGDVGGGTRLDYTAYGNAMNTAARLEAANKELGTAICIGPTTAAQLSNPSILRPLGKLAVRGRSVPMQVHDIWPAAMTGAQRDRHLAAMRASAADPGTAVAEVKSLAAELGGDVVLERLAERLAVQRAEVAPTP